MQAVSVTTNFRRKELAQKVASSKRRLLYGFGGYGRKVAQSSMKKAPAKPSSTHGEYKEVRSGKNKGQVRFRRGASSATGTPPHYRSKARGLRSVEFEVDLAKDSVKFGPVKLGGASRRTATIATKSQEFGGTTTYKPARKRSSRSGRKSFSNQSRKASRPRRITYRKRPFINPAGVKAVANLRKQAKGSIR